MMLKPGLRRLITILGACIAAVLLGLTRNTHYLGFIEVVETSDLSGFYGMDAPTKSIDTLCDECKAATVGSHFSCVDRIQRWVVGGNTLREAQRTVSREYSECSACDPDVVCKMSAMVSLGSAPLVIRNDSESPPLNRLHFVAQFGLGHRLSRMSAAYHLARELHLSEMTTDWGKCSGQNPIFFHLFGHEPIRITGFNNTINGQATEPKRQGKVIQVVNDVRGYYSASNYKAAGRRVPKYFRDRNNNTSPWWDKIRSDITLFQQLEDRFHLKRKAFEFMQQHQFTNRTVVGVHLRAGNNEQDHFKKAGRGIDDELGFVQNLSRLLEKLIQFDLTSMTTKLPPLVFLATDTSYLIPAVENATRAFGVETIVMPQLRLESGKGVTFSNTEGQQCLAGWDGMLLDTIVLGYSKVLVAATYSTFTQVMPLSLVFSRGNRFCEVATNASYMSCFDGMETWLFRQKELATFALRDDDTSNLAVQHSETLVLPDVDGLPYLENLQQFLQSSNQHETKTLGTRFEMKYRNMPPANRSGWILSEDQV